LKRTVTSSKLLKTVIVTLLLLSVLSFAFVSNPIKAESSTELCPQGIVSYWKFNEGNGVIAYDSADDNDGDIAGAT